ncbi:MAG: electron transfer flavoprotein subunit beta/FixA family protein [Pseudobacteriovorax sp.]|nr:electron transfer flavoprotein subunit beta/FixA family protein [Pseudobacteriovorax sp.]
MKILVLIKKTPDTETKIELSADQSSVDHSATKFIINPYDEYAIEEALQIKEAQGSGEVIIASFSDSSCKDLIVKGLAMGGDRGVLVNNEGLESTDALGVAKVLKGLVSQENPDLILCGKQGIDDDNMQVGTMLAELLDLPHVNVANKVTIEGSSVTVEREVEGGQTEILKFEGPGIIGANKSLNSPRYTSLPGIMKAKKKPFEIKTVDDLGVDRSSLESKVTISSFTYPQEKPPGKVFQDKPIPEMVEEVVGLLRNEAKVL